MSVLDILAGACRRRKPAVVKSLLYGVEADDPVAIAIAVALLAACGLAAGVMPARRAARIDPMVAVRHE